MARSGPKLGVTFISADSGTISPVRRAHLQQADVLGARAVRRVGLHAHRVGAAELVEVVHVQAAEVDLHRVEHVGHRHAELARLGAVDVGVELRHVDLVAREQAGELGRLRTPWP